jgi:hypothetical protein
MYDYDRLIDGTILTTSAASVFTNVLGTAWIKTIILHNYSAVDATVTLFDGVAGDSTQFFSAKIPAGGSVIYEVPYPGIKKTGVEVLQAMCSLATTCNIRAFGGAE